MAHLQDTKTYQAFTLVELMISTALFAMVVTLSVGALFTAEAINTRLQATHTILDGMNLSFELMSRDIRYGSIFYCGNDITLASERSLRQNCPFDFSANPGGSVLVFKPVDAVSPNDRIGYYVQNGKIFRFSYLQGVEQTPKQITSDEVTIDTFKFFVSGANTTQQAINNGNNENKGGLTDTLQPFITAVITGKVTAQDKSKTSVTFQLQTSITPRGIDN